MQTIARQAKIWSPLTRWSPAYFATLPSVRYSWSASHSSSSRCLMSGQNTGMYVILTGEGAYYDRQVCLPIFYRFGWLSHKYIG
jgi:hypothetical protein